MPAGRPRKILNESSIVEWAAKGLTQEEIAAVFNVSADTIRRNYAGAWDIGRKLCNGSLRAKQVEVAMSGNSTMLIWLGKQNLGQKERTEVEHKYEVSLEAIPVVDLLNVSGQRPN